MPGSRRHLLPAIPVLGVMVAAAVLPPASATARSSPRVSSPPVRSYEAPRAATPPAVDGVLDDAAWRNAPWTEPFVDIRGEDWPEPALTTRAKVTWDERYLYVGAELEEPHLWATLADRDAIVYHEHDFEVFLDPDGDALAYYELEINALGTEFDLFLDRPYSRKGKANVGWDMQGLRTAVRLDGTLNDPSDEDAGWFVEIAIPWSALRPPGAPPEAAARPPRAGDTWRVNFSRVQWPLEIVDGEYRKEREPRDWSDHPEANWVWSPQGEIDMHIPEMWGAVRFVDSSEPGSGAASGTSARPRAGATLAREGTSR